MWRMYDDADVHASRHEPCSFTSSCRGTWTLIENILSACGVRVLSCLVSKHSVSVLIQLSLASRHRSSYPTSSHTHARCVPSVCALFSLFPQYHTVADRAQRVPQGLTRGTRAARAELGCNPYTRCAAHGGLLKKECMCCEPKRIRDTSVESV